MFEVHDRAIGGAEVQVVGRGVKIGWDGMPRVSWAIRISRTRRYLDYVAIYASTATRLITMLFLAHNISQPTPTSIRYTNTTSKASHRFTWLNCHARCMRGTPIRGIGLRCDGMHTPRGGAGRGAGRMGDGAECKRER
jgi:hypothetical protein